MPYKTRMREDSDESDALERGFTAVTGASNSIANSIAHAHAHSFIQSAAHSFNPLLTHPSVMYLSLVHSVTDHLYPPDPCSHSAPGLVTH